MARLKRLVLPGQPHHVIVRGNNRQAVFVTDEDYRFYLEKLVELCERYRCAIHAYVLMTNHVHLLVTPDTKDGLGRLMQGMGRYYVRYFNHCYRRTGALWEGRFKSAPVDSERYLLTCYRYIELNPVRAAMVEHPAQYPWSSYRSNGLGEDDPVVIPHPLFQALGQGDKERQVAYKALFDRAIDPKDEAEIRWNTAKSWAIGDTRFKEQIEQATARAASPRPRGGRRRGAAKQ
ncbi:transposase [Motiliproteus coralliicola]|uniref:Transposase n=1 Tax=Motiliproteus coralliicola TaxID=2283196 RepID=A0A369WS88_9GAMM|nr:transposase [Motiliproteus coralliicola]RDE22355.1 transposase [Motiliproteus coralliicola]